MKSKKAEELFGVAQERSEQDPRRKRAKRQAGSREHCSDETEWELQKESRSALQHMSYEVTDEQAEAINRRVMDRIYEESPWLVPGEHRRSRVSPAARKYMSVWIAGFLAVFLCSFLFLNLNGSPAPEASTSHTALKDTGILPTGVLENESLSENYKYDIPVPKNGIMDPLVVSMVPTYPQYWMFLSILAVALALFSLGWIHRVRR